MQKLPVIVGFGGANPAGRVSFHHAYRRLVIERLSSEDQVRTYQSLATLMGVTDDVLLPETQSYLRNGTLVRKLDLFDPIRVPRLSSVEMLSENDEPLQFLLAKKHLPTTVPDDWTVTSVDAERVMVQTSKVDALLPNPRVSRVGSAGQMPSGFDPGATYQSRSHPRGLQLAVFGASDTLRSMGIDINTIKATIGPDEFAVYSGSAMGQMDNDGYAGVFQNPLLGKRGTAKNVPLGLPDMAGAFVNAYVLGSVGETAGIIGACATFLYNVKRGADEIRSGQKRFVLAGNSEAPIVPDVMEGYRIMGALAEDEELMALDGSLTPDHRRACRPFSSNSGFTVAEAGTFVLMMDDELAMELGANVLGAVGGVYVNADGFKKSIPGPGIGNYLTVGKAMACARSIIGERGLRNGTQMQAHGTGTPANRVTESHILNEMAKTFGIEKWPVGAVKAYLGHTLAPAGADQLAAILGTWHHGLLPGITTIDHIADDVHRSHLELPLEHMEIDPARCEGAFINSKGFGGNNATGFFLSPATATKMLNKRWGKKRMTDHRRRNETVAERSNAYDNDMLSATLPSIYQFGVGVVDPQTLDITAHSMGIPGFSHPVSLDLENPFADMTD